MQLLKLFLTILLPFFLFTNPTGGEVINGSATLSSENRTLTITQTSDKAILHWQDFSIRGGEKVEFKLPSSSSSTLNRVTGANSSKIYGQLKSNGALYLINPHGIVIGPSGWVEMAGFLASTYDLSDSDYLTGTELNFTENPLSGNFSHLGFVHCPSGNIILIAKEIDNDGVLLAPQGKVSINGGYELYVIPGDSMQSVIRLKKSGKVKEGGTIQALEVEIQASGGTPYALAVESTGLIDATAVDNRGGKVVLFSEGTTKLSSHINAKKSSTIGGEIQILGSTVRLEKGAIIKTIDGTTGSIFIGGNYQDKYTVSSERTTLYQAPEVILQTGSLERLER